MKVLGVIPARYESTRFPGKPLYEIKGKPLIEWVYKKCSRSRNIDRLIIATDSTKIADCARSFGAEVFMSHKKHTCGSDRVAEVAATLRYPVVVNIQGDEIVSSTDIIWQAVKALLKDPNAWIGTVAHPVKTVHDLKNPDNVKVVVDKNKRALYFSRSPIPFTAGKVSVSAKHYNHIGIYAFRNRFLQKFAKLKQSPLEKVEKLEQLRAIENGGKIYVNITNRESYHINRPEDIKLIKKFI